MSETNLSSPGASLRSNGLIHAIALALVLTAINVVKPPIVDDALYIDLARHISSHFLDPYGFDYLWFQWREPAIRVTSPALVPYWLAICVRLFGAHFAVLKAWMFPWNLLFAYSIQRLLFRVAPTGWVSILWLIGLSPAILPGGNLMLDLPAMALVLTSIWMISEAVDRNSVGWVLAAGVAAGLAGQTKFTGLMAFPLLFSYAALYRRPMFGAIGVVAGMGLFLGWESLMQHVYGDSILNQSLSFKYGAGGRRIVELSLALISGMGVLGTPIVILVLQAVRAPRGAVFLWAAIGTVPILLTCFFPIPAMVQFAIGAGAWCCVAACAVIAIRRLNPPGGMAQWWSMDRRIDLFLGVWALGELAAYFVLSPFPASRRFIGISIVGPIVIARLSYLLRQPEPASHSELTPVRVDRLLPWVGVLSALIISLFISVVDTLNAWAVREAFNDVMTRISVLGSVQETHYVGCWNAKYEAPRVGMVEAFPEETVIRNGSCLVVPAAGIFAPSIATFPSEATVVWDLKTQAPTRLSTQGTYIGAYPVQHAEEPLLELKVIRANRDFLLRSGLSLEELEKWARSPGFKAPPGALRPLADAMLQATGPAQLSFRDKLLAMSAKQIFRLSRHPDARLRIWSINSVQTMKMPDEDRAAIIKGLEQSIEADPDPEVRRVAEMAVEALQEPREGGDGAPAGQAR